VPHAVAVGDEGLDRRLAANGVGNGELGRLAVRPVQVALIEVLSRRAPRIEPDHDQDAQLIDLGARHETLDHAVEPAGPRTDPITSSGMASVNCPSAAKTVASPVRK
jgi:hypothetical protein